MRKIIDHRRSTGSGRGGSRSPGTTKKLTLNRETLRELTASDLRHLVGGVEDGTSIRCGSDDI